MGTNVTFDGTSYTVPSSGELQWGTPVSSLLIALAQKAATNTAQKTTQRTISGTTATVLTSDRTVILTGPSSGATACTLPAGVTGQIIGLVDGAGMAGTNAITVAGNGGQTINGAASLVMNHDRETVEVQWDGSDWKIISRSLPPGTVVDADVKAGAAIAWSKLNKTGSNLTDITTRSHTALSDIGTNTHAQIDTHIANTSNPHSVTKTQVGLANVTNDAQVKKISSSVSGNFMSWSGTGGDTPADSGYAAASFEPSFGFSTYLDQAVKTSSSPSFVAASVSGGIVNFTGNGSAATDKLVRTATGVLNWNNGTAIFSDTASTIKGAVTIGPQDVNNTHNLYGNLYIKNNTYAILDMRTYSDTAYPIVELYRLRGTRASPTQTKSGDILGSFDWYGTPNGTAAEFQIGIRAIATSDITSNSQSKLVVTSQVATWAECIAGAWSFPANVQHSINGHISLPNWGGAAQSTATGLSGQKAAVIGTPSGSMNIIANGWATSSNYKHGTANQALALLYAQGATNLAADEAFGVYSSQSISHLVNSDATIVNIFSVKHTGAVTIPTSITIGTASGNYTPTAMAHYQEGTWGPVPSTTGTVGSPSYSSTGRFTRIGNMVFVSCFLSVGSWSGSPTGSLIITGLPFTSSSTSGMLHYSLVDCVNVTSPANSVVVAYINANSSSINIGSMITGTCAVSALAVDTQFDVYFSICYRI